MLKLTKPQRLTLDIILGIKDWKQSYCKSSFEIRSGSSKPRLKERVSAKKAIEQLKSLGLIEVNPETGILRPTPKYFDVYDVKI